jgi:uncharacterized protein
VNQELFHIDFIHALASKLKNREPGRTALMKLAYFAQELKGVPLGYNFTLYSYGPFDSAVLSDLDIAETMSAVRESVYYHDGGYGYKISAHPDWTPTSALEKYDAEISEIVNRFGELKPSELELLSTLVYIDREAKDRHQQLSMSRLIDKTHDIKPRFSRNLIAKEAEVLLGEGLLSATHATSVTAP